MSTSLQVRPLPQAPAPDLSTVPGPTDSVTAVLARFPGAGFSPREAVALLLSHTVAAAVRKLSGTCCFLDLLMVFPNFEDAVDVTTRGTPFDSSTSFTFDTQIFPEVLRGKRSPGYGPQPGEVSSRLRDASPPRLRLFSTMSHCLLLASLDQFSSRPSPVIRVPVPAQLKKAIKYPASFSKKDVQIACPLLCTPTLRPLPALGPTVPAVSGS